MINTTFESKINIPKFFLKDDLKIIADRIFIPILQENIHNQVSLTGGALPALEPATIAKKRGDIVKRTFTKKGNIRSGALKKIAAVGLQGFSSKTLIESGKLVSSFFSKEKGKNTVVITINSARKEIARILQIEGVGKKRKTFNFFGISSRMEKGAIKYMKERIEQEIKNAKGR